VQRTINIFTENNELTVYTICKWLSFLNIDYVKIYPGIEEFILCIQKDEKYIRIDKNKFDFSYDQLYWYRRGELYFNLETQTRDSKQNIYTKDAIKELNVLKEVIYKLIEDGKCFASFQNAELNRLHILITADKYGLKVPNFLATNSKKELTMFFNENKTIVNKPLGNGLFDVNKNKMHATYTSIFTKNDMNKLPEFFFPSLFLEYINKEYEVRAFYISCVFYSMAIMSQSNSKTKIDFRRYDIEFPNRYTPFKLPSQIERKLRSLIKHLKLNTCSIDILVDKSRNYYFLEINPVGQFTFVGHPCNYYLEKIFAQNLISFRKNKSNEKEN